MSADASLLADELETDYGICKMDDGSMHLSGHRVLEIIEALRRQQCAQSGWINNHEWPKLTADVTDMQAVRVKRDDGKGYIWKWLDDKP